MLLELGTGTTVDGVWVEECNRFFSSMSTENDNSSSFLHNVGFRVYIRGYQSPLERAT